MNNKNLVNENYKGYAIQDWGFTTILYRFDFSEDLTDHYKYPESRFAWKGLVLPKPHGSAYFGITIETSGLEECESQKSQLRRVGICLIEGLIDNSEKVKNYLTKGNVFRFEWKGETDLQNLEPIEFNTTFA